MGAMASQIINHTIVYPTVYSGADQKNHQSSASLAFVRGIHWWPVNSPHKWTVTQKMFQFDDVIRVYEIFVVALVGLINLENSTWECVIESSQYSTYTYWAYRRFVLQIFIVIIFFFKL